MAHLGGISRLKRLFLTLGPRGEERRFDATLAEVAEDDVAVEHARDQLA